MFLFWRWTRPGERWGCAPTAPTARWQGDTRLQRNMHCFGGTNKTESRESCVLMLTWKPALLYVWVFSNREQMHPINPIKLVWGEDPGPLEVLTASTVRAGHTQHRGLWASSQESRWLLSSRGGKMTLKLHRANGSKVRLKRLKGPRELIAASPLEVIDV